MEQERRSTPHHKYFAEMHWQTPQFVGPGEFAITGESKDMLVAETAVGVVICIYDPQLRLGGMAHLVLPEPFLQDFAALKSESKEVRKKIERPIENLIRSLKQSGAGKKRIRIRMFGGSGSDEDEVDVGVKHQVFTQQAIMEKGLNVMSQDIGGDECRRIHFFPYTGRIMKHYLRREGDREALRQREQRYVKELRAELEQA